MNNAKVFQGGKISVIEELDDYLESKNSDIAPQVYLMNNLKLIDFSSLTSISHILNAVQQELNSSDKAAIIIEIK
ncbi:MAG TPA: hypothetical protein HA290_03350 [Candidatus Nitrosotenuis sp.]|nr:hypothetical protein [Candidatus Nitrosotenuis sp.]